MSQISGTADYGSYVDAPSERPGCASPRLQMAARLPPQLQRVLTWITAQPAPGETPAERSPHAYAWDAAFRTVVGVLLGAAPWLTGAAAGWTLVPLGWLLAASGLGLFQVVIFHHCAHGTVFRTRELNRRIGRLISAVLLFKQFDAYQREHMLHHSARKLLTDEDEFASFIFGTCRLRPGESKRILWFRVFRALVSPLFHLSFARRRLDSSLAGADRPHQAITLGAIAVPLAGAIASGTTIAWLVAWVVPLIVLLQIATVLRILCEHRFPTPAIMASRDKAFVCHATAGVFAGRTPPSRPARSIRGLAEWARWWADMLIVQLFVRMFVLVGDAPCHDFHHRHPASKKWATYIHARQHDKDRGCPGFPVNYIETWGLLRAIDENLASLSATRPEWL